MSKKFVATLLALGLIFVGFVWFGNKKDANVTLTDTKVTAPAHIIGKLDAQVKLVEYSDFQCPACGLFFPIIEQVMEKYKDKISFEYRHYPLVAAHQNAFAAARASEAAASQGKFWEMYSLLFSNQAKWESASNSRAIFEDYAGTLGLDLDKFKTDFASSEVFNNINASIAEFNSRGLPMSTPTFLLNDKLIEPRNSVEEFSKLIDEQLGKSES